LCGRRAAFDDWQTDIATAAHVVRMVGEMMVRMTKLIAGALVGCATIVLVAWAITRHVNNKQDAEWCHENGYTNYATKDGFCVGAGGKLIKVGRQ
jgi:hypothetical protein